MTASYINNDLQLTVLDLHEGRTEPFLIHQLKCTHCRFVYITNITVDELNHAELCIIYSHIVHGESTKHDYITSIDT